MLIQKIYSKSGQKALSPTEEQAKLNELRCTLGLLSGCASIFCSDACLHRYLRVNNRSIEKSREMLNKTIKWRAEYKPEEIKWEYVAKEGETGKIFRANFCDMKGRPVLVMRPGVQSTNQLEGQTKYFVYCMENAIINLPPDQEQFVWLIDFKEWKTSGVSVKSARETLHILQNHYPERLAYAILYNPPRIFEIFWKVIKPFLHPQTLEKSKFVYSNDEDSDKLMRDLFDLDKLAVAFGGKNLSGFDPEEYGKRMKEDDIKMVLHWALAH